MILPSDSLHSVSVSTLGDSKLISVGISSWFCIDRLGVVGFGSGDVHFSRIFKVGEEYNRCRMVSVVVRLSSSSSSDRMLSKSFTLSERCLGVRDALKERQQTAAKFIIL